VLTNVVGNGKDLHVPKNIAELAALSGMPADQAKRVVVIAQRQLKTLQSGQRLSHQWQITWKNTERWSNPLMGWTSTADPMSNVKLNFDTQEAAVAFANRNGWKYEIRAETSKTNTPPGTYLYKHNFLDKRTAAEVQKLGHKTQIFEMPSFGESHWFMPLKYHGDGEVIQHGPKPSSK
jgi:NADH dehydrogenase (ubiquinone) Fe-S protein 4